jgi:hypothetical protein
LSSSAGNLISDDDGQRGNAGSGFSSTKGSHNLHIPRLPTGACPGQIVLEEYGEQTLDDILIDSGASFCSAL